MVKTIGNVQLDAKIRAVADAAIAVGKPVVVNSDGTVSEVNDSAVSQEIGTPVTFQPYFQEDMAVAFDASTGKFVLAYKDFNDSSRGKAIVGTISGTSVSFGSAVQFDSGIGIAKISIAANGSGKVLISYQDGGNSNYGTAIVGTISGTSISFGTAVVFESATTNLTATAYDVAADKFIIAYRDGGNSGRGTAIVGTVSGTSVSFGTASTFTTSNLALEIGLSYDSQSEKSLVSFTDSNQSERGFACVLSISGTSVTSGTDVEFETGYAGYVNSAAIGNGNVVIAYTDSENNDYLTCVIGTISGTSVTFGSNITPGTNADDRVAEGRSISLNYDSNADKLLITYRDRSATNIFRYIVATSSDSFASNITFGTPTELISGVLPGRVISGGVDTIQNKILLPYTDATASTIGKAVVFKNESGNLNSENFIGFADSSYADTQSASVDSTCSINTKQTGLTTGSKYYVQKDGTLSTTAGTPSVEAGLAISATEILVKG